MIGNQTDLTEKVLNITNINSSKILLTEKIKVFKFIDQEFGSF